MISRVWRGWTHVENAQAYEALVSSILPGHRQRGLAGYRGAYLYRRNSGDTVEFVTTMLFDTLDAVKAFAGPEYERAVLTPAARALLLRFDEEVAHFTVLLTPAEA